MLRLFTALDVPPDVAEALSRRQQGVPGARWSPAENLHITLAFFGEVRETAAADLDAELSRVSSKPFEVALQGVGAFGEGQRVNSIWAGVGDSEPLRVLAGRCEAAARRAGIKLEARVYRPHLTLAYLNRHADPDRAAGWIAEHNLLSSPPWPVRGFSLYSSWRSDDGSRYEIERAYRLS